LFVYTKTGLAYDDVTDRPTDLVSIHKSRENKTRRLKGNVKKGYKQFFHCKMKGKEARILKSHDWEYCFDSPNIKKKAEMANEAGISEDEHGFVASVLDSSEYGMKAIPQLLPSFTI
jgi:hypothetical protein